MKIKFRYRFEDREGTVVGIKTLSTGNLAILVQNDEAIKSFLVSRMTDVSTETEVTEPLETRIAALEARFGDDSYGPATKEELARVMTSVQWFKDVALRLGLRVSKLERRA